MEVFPHSEDTPCPLAFLGPGTGMWIVHAYGQPDNGVVGVVEVGHLEAEELSVEMIRIAKGDG